MAMLTIPSTDLIIIIKEGNSNCNNRNTRQ